LLELLLTLGNSRKEKIAVRAKTSFASSLELELSTPQDISLYQQSTIE
jgi:hypothetical protein